MGRSIQINLYFSSSLVFCWKINKIQEYYGRELSKFNQDQGPPHQPVSPKLGQYCHP